MSKEKIKKNLLIYREYLEKEQKNPISLGEFLYGLGNEYTGLIFLEGEKDSLGGSGGNPTWGYLYEYFGEEENEEKKLIAKGYAIHKEYDYDYPYESYHEKLYSILAKKVIKNCRIPYIDIAFLQNSNNPSTLSHCIFDQNKEEMFEIKDYLYNIFEREDLNKKEDTVLISEILESIKMSVTNIENYKEIEESVIQVLILDSIVNNPDRHPNNWAIVRNIKTGKYSLGIFDNGRSFYNVTKYINKEEWICNYVLTEERKRNGLGDRGDKIIRYIKQQYPEILKKFIHRFIHKLPEFYEEIEDLPNGVNKGYLRAKIEQKVMYIYKMFEEEREENNNGQAR